MSFFVQNAEVVARQLLGAVLVRQWPNRTAHFRIVETEAYTGREDQASHGRNHPTPRSVPIYGRPGLSYVYVSRGIHQMFNVVCEPEGEPAAVLVRAVEPLDPGPWGSTDGPGKLCKTLEINRSQHQIDLSDERSALVLVKGLSVGDEDVCRGPRVGMGKTPEPWFSCPRRWWIRGNAYVSRKDTFGNKEYVFLSK